MSVDNSVMVRCTCNSKFKSFSDLFFIIKCNQNKTEKMKKKPMGQRRQRMQVGVKDIKPNADKGHKHIEIEWEKKRKTWNSKSKKKTCKRKIRTFRLHPILLSYFYYTIHSRCPIKIRKDQERMGNSWIEHLCKIYSDVFIDFVVILRFRILFYFRLVLLLLNGYLFFCFTCPHAARHTMNE